MKKVLLSAVVVAHNEERHLPECLASLKFADEIVVVLDKCTDGSKAIAKKFAGKIVEGSWDIEGVRRNISLDACHGEWVLEVDADERVSKELASEIRSVIKGSEPYCYRVWFDNYIGKRLVKYGWLRSWGVLEKQCLCYKGIKRYKENSMIHPEAEVNGKTIDLKGRMIHFLDNDISDAIKRFDKYTRWRANDMVSSGKVFVEPDGKVRAKGGSFKYYRNFIHRFLKSLVFKKGYKEGGYGFFNAMMAGLYPVVSYIKAVEILENKKAEAKKINKGRSKK
jgi:glycosyltransferase involved in cell wall biosynthesis